MKKIFFPIVIAVAAVAAGCAKEEALVPENQSGVTVFTAGIQTRTVLQDDKAVLWTDGDKINVNGVESEALDLDEASATATFKIQGVLNAPYKAVYPASAYKDNATVNFPATQTYKAGTFSENDAPMVAYAAEEPALVFQHLVNLVKLTVTADADIHQIKYVEFKGNAGEQVSGDFTVDFVNATLASASASDADKVVRYSVAQNTSAEGLVMDIAVPAQEFSAGFTVKIVDKSGHVMEKSKGSAVTLAAGKIYELPAFAFVPTRTEFDVNITSAADLNAFVAKYNAGEYSEDVVVNVANDFAFTEDENAAFVSISEFKGTLYGNNSTISNFNSGKPLVTTALTGSAIENLTIAGNATISATTKDMNVGTFVGTSQAVMIDCHNEVNYTIASNHSEGYLAVGGLIGRLASGKVIDCSSCGNIEFASSFSSVGELSLYVGGLVGRNSNQSGLIENSIMGGIVKFLGTAEYNVYLGGITGYANGTIKDCKTLSAGENHAVSDSYNGTILIDTDAAKYVYAAGVLGYGSETSQVDGCENNAEVCANLIRNTNDECRRVRLAGVVAHTDGQINLSENNAAVSLYSSVKTQWLAGVAATVGVKGSVNDCANSGTLLLGDAGDADQGGRENYIGGLIAENSSTSVAKVTNDGDVTIEMIDFDNETAYLYVGGCVGVSKASLTGNQLIVNNGNISWNSENGWVTKNSFALGGVVGIAHSDVTGVVNTGFVKVNEQVKGKTGKNVSMGGVVGLTATAADLNISNCENQGEVNFNVLPVDGEANNTRKYENIYVGGIIGSNPSTVNLHIDECHNSGMVTAGINKRNDSVRRYVGGIIGLLEGASEISNCRVTGFVYNDDWNNEVSNVGAGDACGGIVGRALGLETNYIEISDCSVTGNVVKSRRGWIGGIAGYVKWTTVSGCNCSSNIEGVSSYSGGICGQMVAAEMENCEASLSIESGSQCKSSGGLAAAINATSSITGSTYRGGNITSSVANAKYGLLVGDLAAGATVSGCFFKGSINGVAGDASKAFGAGSSDNATNNTLITE